jgi:hypothetical protein
VVRSPGGEGGGAMDKFSRALERALDEEDGDVPHEAMVYAINSMDVAVAAMTGARHGHRQDGHGGYQGADHRHALSSQRF